MELIPTTSSHTPDETTILNFRHLLERHNLGQGLLEEINAHLESQGLRLREGTIVDASIIEAPSSTKNRAKERDPEMHQTKKGNEWHFGMKIHIGVDAGTGLVHSMSTTAANAHDVTEAHHLLHGGGTDSLLQGALPGPGQEPERMALLLELSTVGGLVCSGGCWATQVSGLVTDIQRWR